MKKALSIGLQAALMLLANAVGFFKQPFHVVQVFTSVSAQSKSSSGAYYSSHMILTTKSAFLWDGILLMLIVFGLILLTEGVSKRLPRAAVGSTIALLMAAALGLVAGFGTPLGPLLHGL